MSRIACVFGFSLGVFSVVIGLLGDSVLARQLVIGLGGLLMVLAVLGFRGNSWALGLMSFLGLVAMARALPIYFQTTELWPYVAFILGGSLTLGLGVLGILLDRFQPPPDHGSGGL